MPVGPGPMPMTILKRKYLFVDGAALDNAALRMAERYFGDGVEMPISHQKLVDTLEASFDKVFYYDAVPIQGPGEDDQAWRTRTAPKRALLESIELLDRFEVFEGDVRRKGGGRERSRGQKKVDVAIAVGMLTHAFRHNMDEATLIAGDIDFFPLLQALSLEGMPVTLYYPPDTTTAELKRVALIRRELSPLILWRLATREFLDQFPIPGSHIAPLPPLQGAEVLAEWVEPDGTAASLYQFGTETVFRKNREHASRLEVRSRHQRSLLHFLKDQFGIAIPDGIPGGT